MPSDPPQQTAATRQARASPQGGRRLRLSITHPVVKAIERLTGHAEADGSFSRQQVMAELAAMGFGQSPGIISSTLSVMKKAGAVHLGAGGWSVAKDWRERVRGHTAISEAAKVGFTLLPDGASHPRYRATAHVVIDMPGGESQRYRLRPAVVELRLWLQTQKPPGVEVSLNAFRQAVLSKLGRWVTDQGLVTAAEIGATSREGRVVIKHRAAAPGDWVVAWAGGEIGAVVSKDEPEPFARELAPLTETLHPATPGGPTVFITGLGLKPPVVSRDETDPGVALYTISHPAKPKRPRKPKAKPAAPDPEVEAGQPLPAPDTDLTPPAILRRKSEDEPVTVPAPPKGELPDNSEFQP